MNNEDNILQQSTTIQNFQRILKKCRNIFKTLSKSEGNFIINIEIWLKWIFNSTSCMVIYATLLNIWLHYIKYYSSAKLLTLLQRITRQSVFIAPVCSWRFEPTDNITAICLQLQYVFNCNMSSTAICLQDYLVILMRPLQSYENIMFPGPWKIDCTSNYSVSKELKSFSRHFLESPYQSVSEDSPRSSNVNIAPWSEDDLKKRSSMDSTGELSTTQIFCNV